MGELWLRIWGYFSPKEHPERWFVLKALLIVGLALLARSVIGWLAGSLFFCGLFFFLSILLLPLTASLFFGEDKSLGEVFRERFTLSPVPYVEGDFKRQPWGTYTVIAICVFVFYGLQGGEVGPFLAPYIWLPRTWNHIDLLWSWLTACFLHADPYHLWGNMAFLWGVGSALEQRIGTPKFLGSYLACCALSTYFEAVFSLLTAQQGLHGLGASGAIAGVIGLYAVRCYFQTMVVPVPLGAFFFLFHLNLKVRLPSLALIGLFFFSNLKGSIQMGLGVSQDHVGYTAHLFGFLAGVWLGFRTREHKEAVREHYLVIGQKTLDDNEHHMADFENAAAVVGKALASGPETFQHVLTLARLEVKNRKEDEARRLYEKAIGMALGKSAKEGVEIYRELQAAFPLCALRSHSLTMRVADALARTGEFRLSTRLFDEISRDEDAHEELRVRAMFRCAELMEAMGYRTEAGEYYRRVTETWPASVYVEKARKRMMATT